MWTLQVWTKLLLVTRYAVLTMMTCMTQNLHRQVCFTFCKIQNLLQTAIKWTEDSFVRHLSHHLLPKSVNDRHPINTMFNFTHTKTQPSCRKTTDSCRQPGSKVEGSKTAVLMSLNSKHKIFIILIIKLIMHAFSVLAPLFPYCLLVIHINLLALLIYSYLLLTDCRMLFTSKWSQSIDIIFLLFLHLS